MIEAIEDESLERELFAIRARALPEPALDVDGVFARVRRNDVARATRARIVAWVGAAACAAASMVLAVSDVHGVDGRHDAVVTNDEGAGLVCDRELASRIPREDLESRDDTLVCMNP